MVVEVVVMMSQTSLSTPASDEAMTDGHMSAVDIRNGGL